MPLISVIIPVYNIKDYIARCLDSVLAQTYPELEIIAVDDGSTDGSGTVLDDYAATHSRLRVFHRENSGVTRARFFGISQARGGYIGFVDGDDTIEPDMYERLMNNLRESDADISHCGYRMVFPDRVDWYYNTGFRAVWDTKEGLRELLRGKRIEPGPWNKLFRRELFDGILAGEQMDLTIKYNEDLLMNYLLFKEAGSSVFEDFCPYHYTIRRGSAATSRLTEQKLTDPLRVLHRIMDDCKDPSLKAIVRERLALALIGVATLPDREQRDMIAPHRTEARKELRSLRREILRGNYSTRTKVLTAWASFAPGTYSLVHRLYARVRGTDRKYNVD